MHTARRILSLLSAACLLLALAAASATAREVEVPWSPDAQADMPHTRGQAREAAFRRAVFGEALDILPGALTLPRQDLLRLYLLPQAADYVLSYSEEAAQQPAAPQPAPESDPAAQNATAARPGQYQTLMPQPEPGTPQERLLRLDVTVNRAALKKVLKGMGVYYTTSGTRSFDLALSGDASGAWEELGRLQALSGLTVSRGAEPQLELSTEWVTPEPDKKDKKEPEPVLTWTGRLSMEGDVWTASDVDLSKVWFTLWGRFFSRPGAEAGVVEQVPLAVTGWYAADGVRAFDKELASWDGLVEGETLLRVVMLPDGIGGVWTVRTLDRDALAESLRAVLPGRGLSWDFSEEPRTP